VTPKTAILLIAASENDSNLYYACKFLVPDPIVYFEAKGKKHLILSDLEIDRAKEQAQVHKLLSLSQLSREIIQAKLPEKFKGHPSYALIVHHLFKKMGIRKIVVPTNFPAVYFDSLTRLGYRMEIKPDPFFEGRLVKTLEEKKNIRQAVACVEIALGETVTFLQKAKIKGKRIYAGKELVTSESVRSMLNTRLMELGCVAHSTIVASGTQGSLPHHHGHGPLLPHTPIIFDIFPRHSETLYWGDMTRTMVKGKPSDTVRKMFNAVLEANKRSMEKVKPGANTADIHQTAVDCLEKYGFKTGKLNGRMQGFIHSTGHGLGLDIHELPSVSTRKTILKKGHVITIEPGLYYEAHGGIRLEDDVYVTADGYEKLTRFPKFLEIDRA
jgi:Xaa-Pro aminopeptidase